MNLRVRIRYSPFTTLWTVETRPRGRLFWSRYGFYSHHRDEKAARLEAQRLVREEEIVEDYS